MSQGRELSNLTTNDRRRSPIRSAWSLLAATQRADGGTEHQEPIWTELEFPEKSLGAASSFWPVVIWFDGLCMFAFQKLACFQAWKSRQNAINLRSGVEEESSAKLRLLPRGVHILAGVGALRQISHSTTTETLASFKFSY